ncbi:unnamed protein product [Brassica oleracea var. botrytis]
MLHVRTCQLSQNEELGLKKWLAPGTDHFLSDTATTSQQHKRLRQASESRSKGSCTARGARNRKRTCREWMSCSATESWRLTPRMDVTSFGSRARLKPEIEIQQQRGFSGENARGAFSLTMISWVYDDWMQ